MCVIVIVVVVVEAQSRGQQRANGAATANNIPVEATKDKEFPKAVTLFTRNYEEGSMFRHPWEEEGASAGDAVAVETLEKERFGEGWVPSGPGVAMVGNNHRIEYQDPAEYSNTVESVLSMVHGEAERREQRAWSKVWSLYFVSNIPNPGANLK